MLKKAFLNCTYQVILLDLLEVGLVDELDDRDWLALAVVHLTVLALLQAVTCVYHLRPVTVDWHDHDAVDVLYVRCKVVNRGKEVCEAHYLVLVDYLSCLVHLSRDTKRVRILVPRATSVLPLSILLSLLSSQLNVLLFLELLVLLLSLFAFFFVFFDGEQIVVGLVTEEDSNTFKAEIVG